MSTSSEKIKQGIDIILQSDQYTDEYKRVIMERLGIDYSAPKTEPSTIDTDFDLLKNGGVIITESKNTGSLVTISEKPKAVSGYLEKPKYLEDELIKSVDTDVDELINPPPKEKPRTVPWETHDDLQKLYDQSINDLEDLRDQLNIKISELETANIAIGLLNQTVDSEKLLRAAADNETQASTDRYTSILTDFQIAMQKGIQEAIERVSLSAQVQGLQAQKEVLKEQLEQMRVIVANLQQSVEESADLLSDQQEAAASGALLMGTPGFYEKTNKSGWKVPEGSINYPTAEPLYIRYKTFHNGPSIDFYNLSEEPIIFTFTYSKVSRKDCKSCSGIFLGGPTRIEVPARIESDPGKSSVQFKQVQTHKNKTWNIGKSVDAINVTVSNGDSYTIQAGYRIRSRDA